MPSPPLSSTQATLARFLPRAKAYLGGRRLPFLVFLGLMVLVAFLAAHLTWQFLAPPDFIAGTGTESPAATPGGQAGRENRVARITGAHLFGVANATAPQATAVNAPRTSLDLTLLGVAAGGGGFPSQAIIANGSNQNQHTYGVGATLPGGAVIHGIHSDRVVIAHNGRLESLSLPRVGTSILAAQMSFGNGTGGGISRQAGDAASISPAVRRQIEQHPQQLMQIMKIQPYAAHGKMEGYRVYPGEQPALFHHAGLEPGDVITQVNGVSLTSNAGAMKAMAELRHAKGTVQLVVMRHGKPVHLSVNFSGG